MAPTAVEPVAATVPLRGRVRSAIHHLDTSALYREVFGLGGVADQHLDKAIELLEAAS